MHLGVGARGRRCEASGKEGAEVQRPQGISDGAISPDLALRGCRFSHARRRGNEHSKRASSREQVQRERPMHSCSFSA
eukprot:5406894-Pleurochrysis_carterae.AAC.2